MRLLHWDHPRTCGEKYAQGTASDEEAGSPPHMRGKAAVVLPGSTTSGITPAHAGKRRLAAHSRARCRDHPRTCGEKSHNNEQNFEGPGSPPHMRGKERGCIIRCGSTRITPAHAGKSSFDPASSHESEDHPRTCGEKAHLLCQLCGVVGSPPHMRGKGKNANYGVDVYGITPAHAGKSSVPEL